MSYNKCFIAGIIKGEPYFSRNGDSLLLDLSILRTYIQKEEFLTVSIRKKETIKKAITELEEGDYIISVNAQLMTINTFKTKEIICPHCQRITHIKAKGETTELVLNDFSTIKNDEIESTLPGVNKVLLMGNLYNDPKFRSAINNLDYIKYKIVVTNYEDGNEIKSFPYIVSFNKEAQNAKLYLKKGNTVFIEGALQERHFKQRTKSFCTHCETEFDALTNSYTREVITANVKYLKEKTKEDFD